MHKKKKKGYKLQPRVDPEMSHGIICLCMFAELSPWLCLYYFYFYQKYFCTPNTTGRCVPAYLQIKRNVKAEQLLLLGAFKKKIPRHG